MARKWDRKRLLDPSYPQEKKHKQREQVASWRRRHPEKTAAHRAVYVALRNGTLKKKPCFCGEKKVEAHHHDYRKPLDVVWLCKPHHGGADFLRRRGKDITEPKTQEEIDAIDLEKMRKEWPHLF
jgi:hypothetical protein